MGTIKMGIGLSVSFLFFLVLEIYKVIIRSVNIKIRYSFIDIDVGSVHPDTEVHVAKK